MRLQKDALKRQLKEATAQVNKDVGGAIRAQDEIRKTRVEFAKDRIYQELANMLGEADRRNDNAQIQAIREASDATESMFDNIPDMESLLSLDKHYGTQILSVLGDPWDILYQAAQRVATSQKDTLEKLKKNYKANFPYVHRLLKELMKEYTIEEIKYLEETEIYEKYKDVLYTRLTSTTNIKKVLEIAKNYRSQLSMG